MKITLTSGTVPPPAENRPPLWRFLHDAEMGPLWRSNVPEVFPLNGNRTPFGEDWQKLTFAMNPSMTGQKWRSLYDAHRAFNNGTGFPSKDNEEAKADYVNRRDLSAPLPAWDKTRTCGGAVVTGTVVGPDLIIDILDGNGPAPSLEWLMTRPWYYFAAVNVTSEGITNFPQDLNPPCLVPLVGSGVAKYPVANLQRWTAQELPSPYTIYLSP